jgi:hypothetical protein
MKTPLSEFTQKRAKRNVPPRALKEPSWKLSSKGELEAHAARMRERNAQHIKRRQASKAGWVKRRAR